MADKNKKIWLIETFQPLWKMTHYTGLLLDWVGNPDSTDETNTSSSSPVFKILPRLLIIFLALSSLVVSAIFETFGVIEKLIKLMADSSPIIANLLINIMFNACFNVLHLVIINRNIVKLLAQFHFLESRLLIINYNTKRRYDRIVKRRRSSYSTIIATNLVPFFGIAYMSFKKLITWLYSWLATKLFARFFRFRFFKHLKSQCYFWWYSTRLPRILFLPFFYLPRRCCYVSYSWWN